MASLLSLSQVIMIIVKFLVLEANADVFKEDTLGRTPYNYARQEGRIAISDVLSLRMTARLRWAVVASIQRVRRQMLTPDNAAPKDEFLHRLASVPSGDNSTPLMEGQVFRKIVEYVGY